MIDAPVGGEAGIVAARRRIRLIGWLVFGGIHAALLFGFRMEPPPIDVLAPVEIEVVPKGDAVVERTADEAVVAATVPTQAAADRAAETPPDEPAPPPPIETPAPIAAPGPDEAAPIEHPEIIPPEPRRRPDRPRPARPRLERPRPKQPAEHRPVAAPTPTPTREKALTPAPASSDVRTAGAVDGREDLRAARASYGALVSAEINRHKHYPAAARERNETGSVGMTFVVGPSGTIVAHALRRSSGSAALDAAAEAMLAASRAPPPPGGQFRGSIDIRFAIGR